MPFAYPTCIESENVLCKHVRAVRTYYADLNWIPEGVLVVSATADTEAENLIIDATVVLSDDLTETGCDNPTLYAGRALLIVLSGGTVADDEVLVTLNWLQDDGNEDSRDVRLLVGGRE